MTKRAKVSFTITPLRGANFALGYFETGTQAGGYMRAYQPRSRIVPNDSDEGIKSWSATSRGSIIFNMAETQEALLFVRSLINNVEPREVREDWDIYSGEKKFIAGEVLIPPSLKVSPNEKLDRLANQYADLIRQGESKDVAYATTRPRHSGCEIWNNHEPGPAMNDAFSRAAYSYEKSPRVQLALLGQIQKVREEAIEMFFQRDNKLRLRQENGDLRDALTAIRARNILWAKGGHSLIYCDDLSLVHDNELMRPIQNAALAIL